MGQRSCKIIRDEAMGVLLKISEELLGDASPQAGIGIGAAGARNAQEDHFSDVEQHENEQRNREGMPNQFRRGSQLTDGFDDLTDQIRHEGRTNRAGNFQAKDEGIPPPVFVNKMENKGERIRR